MTTLVTRSPNLGMSTYPNGHTYDLSIPTKDGSYLPTPTSAQPGHQQQYQYPYYNPSPSTSQQAYSPSPSNHQYSPSPSKQNRYTSSPLQPYSPSPIAGPSSYRRTPASKGEQVKMDGIERDVRGMVMDEGDGRVGVEDPRAWSENGMIL